MTTNTSRRLILDTLLNSLEAERHAKVPLLLTVLDELTLQLPRGAVADRARELRASLTGCCRSEATYEACVAEVRRMARALADGITQGDEPSKVSRNTHVGQVFAS